MKKMRELDVKDKRGNIIISPGLKVRHKKSQFEYTVDSVIKEPSGQITVMLARPEAPRFKSRPKKQNDILVGSRNNKVLYEAEPVDDMSSMFYVPEDSAKSDEDLLAVSAAEFEKEYEVK